jgi:hypothetical protein
MAALREEFPDTQLHLIGQLQSNKAEEAAQLFDCIQSLDRPSLLYALARAFDRVGRQVPCFVQVNIGDEAQKGGCALGDLAALLTEAQGAGVPVIGLMCLPPAGLEPTPHFALLDKLAADHGLPGRSMGMSGRFRHGSFAGRDPCAGGHGAIRGASNLISGSGKRLPLPAPPPQQCTQAASFSACSSSRNWSCAFLEFCRPS